MVGLFPIALGVFCGLTLLLFCSVAAAGEDLWSAVVSFVLSRKESVSFASSDAMREESWVEEAVIIPPGGGRICK